jgi:putative ABC transport system permease protein
MFSHYLTLAWKSLIKNKYYTFINIFGLVTGMLTALIIAKYIGGSLESDSFHANKNRIHFISQIESVQGSPERHRNSTYPGVAELAGQYTQVSAFSRYSIHVEALVINGNERGGQTFFTESRIAIVDSTFLEIFTFPLIYGDQRTVLSKAGSIVLTKATSEKYFANADPIGKSLIIRVPWGQETSYQVTGVIENTPKRSRFNFDFLITPTKPNTEESWLVPDCNVYVLLTDTRDAQQLSASMTEALTQIAELRSTDSKVILSLTPITDSQLSNAEYILMAVGIFISLICWLNYINQVVTQSFWRARETGVLRVLGASKMNLSMQFIMESCLTCLPALALVTGAYLILEDRLKLFTNGHLLPLANDPTSVNLIFALVFIAGIVLASVVPVVILFTQKAPVALRNAFAMKIGGVGLRRMLVIIQFSISTVIVISLLVTREQLQYVSSKDKGVEMEDILIIKTPLVRDTTWQVKRKTLEIFKERCRQLPFVDRVTSSTTVPGEEYRQETYLSLPDENAKAMVHQAGVDEHFFGMYEIKFLAGHDFLPDARAKNRNSIILNESAARALGISDFENVIGSRIIDHEESETTYDLIGIVNDHHQTSLKYEIRPMAFRFNEFRGHFSVRMSGAVTNSERQIRMAALREIWEESYPDASFESFNLNERFDAQNLEDMYLKKLFGWFTLLSIIISCMGLFGLSLLMSMKRQKEIAIRVTFGASWTSILLNFLRGYSVPLVISVIFGSSLAYWLMNIWLTGYAYRIEIGFGIIAEAVVSLIVIFLVTVSYHTVKASLADPVMGLKD